MNRKKIFRRGFIALIGVIFALNASIAFAEVYTGVGEYSMTDENVDFAKNQSELAAQRDILDKICVYFKSQSITIDNELDKDEIITIAAGILHVLDTKFHITDDDGEITVKSFVTAQIDTEELKKLLEHATIKYIFDN